MLSEHWPGQAHIMAHNYEYTRLQKITGMPEKYSKSLALINVPNVQLLNLRINFLLYY